MRIHLILNGAYTVHRQLKKREKKNAMKLGSLSLGSSACVRVFLRGRWFQYDLSVWVRLKTIYCLLFVFGFWIQRNLMRITGFCNVDMSWKSVNCDSVEVLNAIHVQWSLDHQTPINLCTRTKQVIIELSQSDFDSFKLIRELNVFLLIVHIPTHANMGKSLLFRIVIESLQVCDYLFTTLLNIGSNLSWHIDVQNIMRINM